jgi:hypothetical protein
MRLRDAVLEMAVDLAADFVYYAEMRRARERAKEEAERER